ncbi:MAG: T9SS type A sorting domain-containing protein [Melioribacteraceae bacterium]
MYNNKLSATGKRESSNVRGEDHFDILGREVNTLVNENQKPGNYEVEWNANECSSGVYFYNLKAGEFTAVKKMILLK